MGQSLVGGLIGGASGAIPHLLTGNIPAALALGAVGFVGGFASSYLAKQATADALASAMGPSSVGPSVEPKFGGYTVNRRGAALHHQVIYGQTKVGGAIVFDDSDGPNNKYLSRIIAFAGHEINAFSQIYMGKYLLSLSGDSVTSAQEIDEKGAAVNAPVTKFNNYIKIRRVLGDHTASLDGSGLTNFSTKWTNNHILRGIAHLAIVFEYVDDVWDEGLPEISALVEGKKVYDPRKDSTSSAYVSGLGVSTHRADQPGTWQYDNNPALIVRDFLTDSNYGLGEEDTNIDDDLIGTAASVSEESVTDGDKYTCNGAWLTSQPPVDVIAQLMTSCAGYLWYAQGKWRLKAGKDVSPTVTLTEDDLRSPLSVATRHSRRDNFNAVRGTFRGPKSNYQFTDYPTVTATDFVTIDGGLESTMDLALPFTDTPEQAQRLANIALEKNRSQITVVGSFGLNAFPLQVSDTVNITNTRFGWTNKLFEVVAWGLSIEDYVLQVDLVLRETTPTTYDEFQNVTGFESDNTTLPGPLGEVVVGTGDVVSTTDVTGLTASGGIREISVNWTNPVNNNYNYTKLHFDTDNNISGASTINVTGQSFNHTNLGAAETRYYWAQAYDTLDNPLGSQIGPVSATTKRAETDDITAQAITTDKIYDLSVTTAKINDLDVTSAKIANLSVGTSKLVQGTYVGSGNFWAASASNAVGTFTSPTFGASANGDAFVLVTAVLFCGGTMFSNSSLNASLIIDGTTVNSFGLGSNAGIAPLGTHTLMGGKANVSGSFTVQVGYAANNVSSPQHAVSVTVWRFLK